MERHVGKPLLQIGQTMGQGPPQLIYTLGEIERQ